MDLFSNTKKK